MQHYRGKRGVVAADSEFPLALHVEARTRKRVLCDLRAFMDPMRGVHQSDNQIAVWSKDAIFSHP